MEAEIEELQRFVDRSFNENEGRRILEAGCGSLSFIRYRANDALVGMDVSRRQLERNAVVQYRAAGDIRLPPFREQSFDLVICWNVLEHLPDPLRAVDALNRLLKPNGLLVLAFPSVHSLKGLITKFTPHWFHVFVYRVILGDKEAGKGDRAPFKTYLRFACTPKPIAAMLAPHGSEVVFDRLYKNDFLDWVIDAHPAWKFLWRAASIVVQAISLGKIRTDVTDCLMAARKRSDERYEGSDG